MAIFSVMKAYLLPQGLIKKAKIGASKSHKSIIEGSGYCFENDVW